MSINDLVVLCRLEPVDAHNLLAVQNAIIFTIIKSLILAYITYFVVLELYNEVHLKPTRLVRQNNRSNQITTNPDYKPGDYKVPVKKTNNPVDSEPDISKLSFEPVVDVKKYMDSKPNIKDYLDSDKYYETLTLWSNTLPNIVKGRWLDVHNYFYSVTGQDKVKVPNNINQLVKEGYKP